MRPAQDTGWVAPVLLLLHTRDHRLAIRLDIDKWVRLGRFLYTQRQLEHTVSAAQWPASPAVHRK